MNPLDLPAIAALAAQGCVMRVLPDGSVEVRADGSLMVKGTGGEMSAQEKRAARNRRYRDRLKAETPPGDKPGDGEQTPAAGQEASSTDEKTPSVTAAAAHSLAGSVSAMPATTIAAQLPGDETPETVSVSPETVGVSKASQSVSAAAAPPPPLSPSPALPPQTPPSQPLPLTPPTPGAAGLAPEAAVEAGDGQADAEAEPDAEANTDTNLDADPKAKPDADAAADDLSDRRNGGDVKAPAPAVETRDAKGLKDGPGAETKTPAGVGAAAKPGEGDGDGGMPAGDDPGLGLDFGTDGQPKEPKRERPDRRGRRATTQTPPDWRTWNAAQAAEANAVALPLLAPAEFAQAWQTWRDYRTRRAVEARVAHEAVAWTPDAAKAALRDCERAADAYGWAAVVARIDEAIAGRWQGINTGGLGRLVPRLGASGNGNGNGNGNNGAPGRPSSSHSSSSHQHRYANHRPSSSPRSDSANLPGRYA